MGGGAFSSGWLKGSSGSAGEKVLVDTHAVCDPPLVWMEVRAAAKLRCPLGQCCEVSSAHRFGLLLLVPPVLAALLPGN